MPKNYNIFYYLFFLFFIFSGNADAQVSGSLKGVVKSNSGQIIPNASVKFDKKQYNLKTDDQGEFFVRKLPVGNYFATVSAIGYDRRQITFIVIPGETKNQIITLTEVSGELDEVRVKGKSAITKVKESAFNVTALDAKRFHNTTLELSNLLNRASGVKVRETGGLGSDASINLNGFSGRHIKIFMDGIPMDGMGSAFQLNNIPVNLAERIEIYKGVVPIELGADALGGAINIITNSRNKSYADVSYSYGSFNTHKTSINLGHTAKNGFTVQLNAFQNYSDNNYRVFTKVLDLKDQNYSVDSAWVKRFNDKYHNETIIGKIGFMNTSWADQFLISTTLGQEYAGIQNAYLMRMAYGERYRKSNTVMPSINYAKRNFITDNLNVRFSGSYNRNYNHSVDTSRYRYNWYGDRTPMGTIGEGSLNGTLAKFYNKNANSTLNLSYNFLKRHSISLNDVISTYVRGNADRNRIVDENTNEDTRSSNLKNTLGLSYKYNLNDKWVTTLFGKHYMQRVTGSMNVSEIPGRDVFERRTKQATSVGYGLATTYFLKKNWQLKFSAERALRMPSDTELFGDEILETGNSTLKPEQSNSFNLGFIFQKDFTKDHALFIDMSATYRRVDNFIRREINQRFGTIMSLNHGLVQNLGLNVEARYYYKKVFNLGASLTAQNIRDQEPYSFATSTQPNVHKGDRIPNQPYLFGNAEAEYLIFNPLKKGDILSFTYALNYVKDFYLRWESLGVSGDKDVVQTQLSHDLGFTYSARNGKYNIGFEARNITDQRLYDNFSLQKPGRSFSVKLRYFFVKNN